MDGLKDRAKKERNLVEKTVLDITKKTKKKDKYAVNVIFDGSMENIIKERAKDYGIGVATYIKVLVSQDLKR